MSRILAAEGRPILIHAAGGIGKSIISTRIGLGMPEGSVTILYDCFGSGEYRNPVHYRHRCKDGIVQISNELAGMGLCHPVIPGPFDNAQYLKAFAYRLEQAAAIINSRTQGPSFALSLTLATMRKSRQTRAAMPRPSLVSYYGRSCRPGCG